MGILLKKSAAPLLTALFLLTNPPHLPQAAYAETPDENNQCTNTGGGAKRESALNESLHNNTKANSQQQQEMGDCFDQKIAQIMNEGSAVGGIGASAFDFNSILEMIRDEACEAFEEALSQYSDVFDISKSLNSGNLLNMDQMSRELVNILRNELKSIQNQQVKFKVPDVSDIGVNNIMQHLKTR